MSLQIHNFWLLLQDSKKRLECFRTCIEMFMDVIFGWDILLGLLEKDAKGSFHHVKGIRRSRCWNTPKSSMVKSVYKCRLKRPNQSKQVKLQQLSSETSAGWCIEEKRGVKATQVTGQIAAFVGGIKVYIYIYLEPKWPLFWLQKALFWGVDLQK